MKYNIAQVNVARMKGVNMDDPVMKEFKDNIDYINNIAENVEGFVWRLQDEEENYATGIEVYDNEQIIVNLSVWEDVSSLQTFTYKTVHAEFVRRRMEWFQKYGKMHYALWWVKKGAIPSVEEAILKLEKLQTDGASHEVFSFKKIYEPK